MALNRRTMMGLSAAGAAALVVGDRSTLAAQAADDIRADALTYFGERGFGTVPPLDLMTGDSFNGGLRYDDTRPDHPRQRWVTVQPAARVEDISERSRPGVLAGFTIIAMSHQGASESGMLVTWIVDFLVSQRKLDPAKMLFVSTERFKPHLPRVQSARTGRFLERPLKEATAAGDGSGFFAPKDHPHRPRVHTVAIYYPVAGAAPAATLSYPPARYIELAEIELVAPGKPEKAESAAIGLERLAIAEGRVVSTFDESRRNLLRAIEAEAKRTGKPLPAGHASFAAL